MNLIRVAVILASVALLGACSTVTPLDVQTRLVSPHYTATGPISSIRAWVYGDRTILDFGNDPISITVKDETGATVPYEKIGHFYRLARKLNEFSVRANLTTTTFSIVGPSAAPITGPAATTPVLLQTVPSELPKAPDRAALSALLQAASQQLAEVREAIAMGARTKAEMKAINAKLDRVEAQVAAASSAVLMVFFESYKSDFKPSPSIARVLVGAGKLAHTVQVRGRTDSVIAGSLDAKIAKSRALSAQRFLVSNGVNPGKIKVSWRAAGDAIAPTQTIAGRAINRRVEIQFYSPTIATLKAGSNTIAQAEAK